MMLNKKIGLKKKSIQSKEDQKNELIVHNNNLIEARYNLTLQEKRLILLMSSRIQKNDKEFQIYTFSVQELCMFLQINNKNIYKEIDTVVSKLFNRILIVKNPIENSTTKISWLTYAKYWHGKGIVHLKFNEDLKPYMLKLKERFTQINLGDVMGLKSVHAIRVYELLKQYETIGKREISLIDLREYCGITTDQYKKYCHIKEKILEISKREINEKTDILIDYEEIKTSRKITSIQFTIKPNLKYNQTEFERMQSQKADIIKKELRSELVFIERMSEYGFSKQAAKKLFKSHGEEVLENALKAVDLQVQKSNVKNPKAMLLTAIQEKWKPDVYKKKKS
jgi:plasmid replication initiation protein